MSETPILDVQSIGVAFGGVRALDDVSLSVGRGSIHGLIGPNGAGKTTLLNVICRIVEPRAGRVTFDGHDLLRLPAHGLAPLGITRTFQNLVLIEDATALDNVRIGLHASVPGGLLDDLLLIHRRASRESQIAARAFAALEKLGLSGIAHEEVRRLPYGTRKMVELARALASAPRLLLLDEPTAGLNDAEIAELQRILRGVRAENPVSMLVVTHHVELLVGLADQTTVLDLGRTIISDTPQRVRNDPRVIAAYMGVG